MHLPKHPILPTFLAVALGVASAFPTLSATPTAPTQPRTADSAQTPVEKSRHNDFMKQIRDGKGDFDFVLIGDSITDGWPKTGPDTYACFAPWKPLDLGVSGETTEEVLWRLENGELEGIHPKVVMLMIGTNNIGRYADEKPEWVAGGIKKIIDTIRAKHPHTKILLLAIFPRDAATTGFLRQRVDATNKLLPALADGKNVFFLDIGPKFLDAQGTLSKQIMPDLLHPNAEGYRIWIEAVKSKLEQLMDTPLAPPASARAAASSPSTQLSKPTVSVTLTPIGTQTNK